MIWWFLFLHLLSYIVTIMLSFILLLIRCIINAQTYWDWQFIWNCIKSGSIATTRIPCKLQLADLFTKTLYCHHFSFLAGKLGIRNLHALTWGESISKSIVNVCFFIFSILGLIMDLYWFISYSSFLDLRANWSFILYIRISNKSWITLILYFLREVGEETSDIFYLQKTESWKQFYVHQRNVSIQEVAVSNESVASTEGTEESLNKKFHRKLLICHALLP